MVDIGSMVAAVNGLAAAGRAAMGLINLKTMSEVQAKAIELNGIILAAQNDLFAANATQTAMVERVRELEAQIARMKEWQTEKQRYKLVDAFPGVPGMLVYALLQSASNGETAHYICTNCYENGKRSILQRAGGTGNKDIYFQCPDPSCGLQAHSGQFRGLGPYKYAEDLK